LEVVDHANTVLSWFENRPSKDVPPRWMWHLNHELEAWFDRLDADQQRDSSSPSGGRDEEAPMMQNALTAGLRG
jgi:hypothetical protein